MTPSRAYKHLHVKSPKPVTKGIDAWVDYSVGYWKRRKTIQKRYYKRALKISEKCEEISKLSDAELRKQLEKAYDETKRTSRQDQINYDNALALVSIASERSLKMRPYPVQIMAALAALDGYLAEMATGEGKTLTIGIAATIMGWTGNPVHLLTANDYLAKRDAEKMKPLYAYCNVKVGYISAEMKPEERQLNYNMDVTYTDSKNLLGDFLRDRLKYDNVNDAPRLIAKEILGENQEAGVMRGIHTALIDEADSVLIDDACNPLIISQKFKNEAFKQCCETAYKITEFLKPDFDYHVNFKTRSIQFTERGLKKVERHSTKFPRMWQGFDRRNDLVRQALVSDIFFVKDKDYIIKDDKVVIVDQSTGRLKEDSIWQSGQHNMIEVKEGLPFSDSTQTIASLTFQNFFRLFSRLGACTGTTDQSENEFWHTFKLSCVKIPTNKKPLRKQYPDKYFKNKADKWYAIIKSIREISQQSRPILIGTNSIKDSNELAELLDSEGIKYNLLNATMHEEEADIVAKAGKHNAVTIATNMAGRGTDIELDSKAKQSGGLHVIAADRMQSSRVDRQLYGRAGRQGDPGSAQTFISMDDTLLTQNYSKIILAKLGTLLRANSGNTHPIVKFFSNRAQRKSEKLQKLQRKHIMKNDNWLKETLTFSGSNKL